MTDFTFTTTSGTERKLRAEVSVFTTNGLFLRIDSEDVAAVHLDADQIAELQAVIDSIPKPEPEPEPEPVDEIATGDRVRILTDGRDEGLRHYLPIGSLAEVITVGESRDVRVKGTATDGRTITQTLPEGAFELYASPLAIGSTVYVTGDERGMGHDFAPGTEVTVVTDDYLTDGTYDVEGVDQGSGEIETYWVGAEDLSVDAPTPPAAFHKGDLVLVSAMPTTGNGGFVDSRVAGLVGKVTSERRPSGSYAVRFEDAEVFMQYVGESSLSAYVAPEPVDETPVFEVGSTVRVMLNGPHDMSDLDDAETPLSLYLDETFVAGMLAEVIDGPRDLFGSAHTYRVRFADGGEEKWARALQLAPVEEDPEALKVGDRVKGYTNAEGELLEIGHGSYGGDCLVRWDKGYALGGSTLGASLARLTRVEAEVEAEVEEEEEPTRRDVRILPGAFYTGAVGRTGYVTGEGWDAVPDTLVVYGLEGFASGSHGPDTQVVKTEHLEYLDEVEGPVEGPKAAEGLKVGDRVRLVSSPYLGTDKQAGATGTIEAVKEVEGPDHYYRVVIDRQTEFKPGTPWGFYDAHLELIEPGSECFFGDEGCRCMAADL